MRYGAKRTSARRGAAALIAMLYLVLLSTMAIGFYSAMSTAVQVSANDDHIARAQTAAESGLEFMRYQLSRVTIPPNTEPSEVLDQLYADLQTQLDDTYNLTASGQQITRDENTVLIPSSGATISLDPSTAGSFNATITDWLGEIVVKVEGHYGTANVTRAITLDFTRQAHSSTVFDFAVASRGQIVMKKGAVTTVTGVDPKIATMMSAISTDPGIKVTGGTIGGDLTVLESSGVEVTGGSVGGSSIPSVILASHVTEIPDAPEFPTVDPTAYRSYAVNDWVDKKNLQKNILVKANTNPTFNANDTVQGILYIESPNEVTFNGSFKLQGFIVMETSGSTTDSLKFKGNVTQSPVPNGAEFNALRSTSGVAILAPGAAVSMTGSTDSFVKGNIIVDTFSFAGSADLTVDQGTLMTLNPGAESAKFEGKNVKFTATGGNNTPTSGISYSQYYVPKPSTYQEVAP
ncbi:MAG: hypothetical protein ACREJC_21930 [Tepidisphaeraceae bacterium]